MKGALALQASPHTKYSIDVAYFNFFIQFQIFVPPFHCFHVIGRSLRCRESGHDKCIETGQNLIENGLKCNNFKYSFKNLGNKNVESGHHLHKNAGVYILQDIVRVERQQGKYETE